MPGAASRPMKSGRPSAISYQPVMTGDWPLMADGWSPLIAEGPEAKGLGQETSPIADDWRSSLDPGLHVVQGRLRRPQAANG